MTTITEKAQRNAPKSGASSRRTFISGLVCSGQVLLPQSLRGYGAPTKAAGPDRETRRYDVRHFGAVGDGTTVCTANVQRAIDALSLAGGGLVVFHAGQYVCGTVLLKTGVALFLEEEAVVLGSLDPRDYKPVDAFVDGVNTVRGYTLVGGVDVQRVGILGPGTIDGRGAELQRRGGTGPQARPFLVRWVRSTDITMQAVKFKNSSAWTMHLFQCSSATVQGVNIRSLGLANNDGIDIDSSQHVRIEDCTIETGDDAICLKTTSNIACKDVHVSGCVLSSQCAAFKIGTESMGDFLDISFSKCSVKEAKLGAIKLLSVDGANIRGVTVEDITIDNAHTPIFLRLGARLKKFRQGDPKLPVGSLSEVLIQRITVAAATGTAVVMSGIPEVPIGRVELRSIHIVLDPPGHPASSPVPEKIDAYPEITMFGGDLPAYALYARHVSHLSVKDLKVEASAGEVRPHSLCEDCNLISL